MNKTFTNPLKLTKTFSAMLLALAVLVLQSPQVVIASPATLPGRKLAQEIVTVKGTVKDNGDGQPMPGVTITGPQKKVLSVTNGEGTFTLTVPKGTELSFNMLGYQVIKKVVNENQTNLVIRLISSSSDLNEVVVTALGIKREANSLGWDPEWQVNYFLDDQPMGLLEQQKGFDPLAVQLYQGDQLPAGRTFAAPKKMDHLFIAHFNPAVKKVKVVVTDRFGVKYINEETVNS